MECEVARQLSWVDDESLWSATQSRLFGRRPQPFDSLFRSTYMLFHVVGNIHHSHSHEPGVVGGHHVFGKCVAVSGTGRMKSFEVSKIVILKDQESHAIPFSDLARMPGLSYVCHSRVRVEHIQRHTSSVTRPKSLPFV